MFYGYKLLVFVLYDIILTEEADKVAFLKMCDLFDEAINEEAFVLLDSQ